MQIAIVLGLLVVATVLFARETLSVDLVTLLVLIGLVASGILTPREAFSGFSDDIVVILVSIFVVSGALQQTGIMDAAAARLHALGGGSPRRLLLALMLTVGGMSSFMNNTTATAVFVAPALGLARRAKISASRLLMPMAFASILGGTCTLIGTSTNVAVSGFIARAGLAPVGLFEITPVGLVVLAIGVVYMLTIGYRLLPDHPDAPLAEEYAIREYLSEIVVVPGSHMIGQRIFESDLAKLEFRILEVIRGSQHLPADELMKIEEGDLLLVQGKIEDLLKVKETAGIEIKPDLDPWARGLEDLKLAEVLVTPRSDLVGRTLREVDFRRRYGVAALAIYRHGSALREKVGRIRLRLGDLLLVQGPAERFAELRRESDFWILEELSTDLFRKRKGLLTVAFFGAGLVVGSIGLLPLSIAILAAAALTLLFRCITTEEAYEFIDWRLIVLIGGMTALGLAMQKTGAAELLAGLLVEGLRPLGVMGILAGLFAFTIMLTQPMSNAAAALVVLPIALETARVLDANPRTFAVGIMLAASVSFIAPFEPSCILVYGPGKYRFADFVKTGIGLTVILMLTVLLLLPVFWPL
jgi:di/tricarboxylate transporter